MNIYERVCLLNKENVYVNHVSDAEFEPYGRIIDNIDFSSLDNYMENTASIPLEGNMYVPSIKSMESGVLFKTLEDNFYGGMPTQIGYCNGKNTSLNGLEYHKSSEINYAVTDMILILGNLWQIRNNIINSNDVKVFFIPRGTVVELFATTLHFAPCKVETSGFKCVVVLPKYTNAELDGKNSVQTEEDKLLFMKNKWLIVHPEAEKLVSRGAYVGIEGSNIRIAY